jgi:hypothetical protein
MTSSLLPALTGSVVLSADPLRLATNGVSGLYQSATVDRIRWRCVFTWGFSGTWDREYALPAAQ